MIGMLTTLKDFLLGTIFVWGKIIFGLFLVIIILIWIKYKDYLWSLQMGAHDEFLSSLNSPLKAIFSRRYRDEIAEEVNSSLRARANGRRLKSIFMTIILAIIGVSSLVASIVVPKISN